MTVTINVSADDLARSYFPDRLTGCVRAPAGMTSYGREVLFIAIARGSRRITLSGRRYSGRWEETFVGTAPIDD